jgi:uncharacterized SAM-binding protein YcdF (DUF218 family)
VLGFGIVVVILYLLRAQVLPPVARFLDVSEPPEAVDYALVLGGGSETRPFVAAALVKAGLAKQVLVPHIQLTPEAKAGIVPSEHELIRRALLARGVPETAVVLLPGEVTSTLDEARVLADFLASRPEGRVAVVTNRLYTRRARLLFRRVLGDQFIRVRFVGAPTDGHDESNWWRFESGWVDYGTEYVKLAFYGLQL